MHNLLPLKLLPLLWRELVPEGNVTSRKEFIKGFNDDLPGIFIWKVLLALLIKNLCGKLKVGGQEVSELPSKGEVADDALVDLI